MDPNRRARERERKAATDARGVISKAERLASRRARTRRDLIRDAVLGLVIALILFGAWKAIALTVVLAGQ